MRRRNTFLMLKPLEFWDHALWQAAYSLTGCKLMKVLQTLPRVILMLLAIVMAFILENLLNAQ